VGAEIVESARAFDFSIREQHEPIADAFGIDQLMNRKNERSPTRGYFSDQVHDIPSLPEVEAVEWFVHQQQRMWRDQGQRQPQAAGISLG